MSSNPRHVSRSILYVASFTGAAAALGLGFGAAIDGILSEKEPYDAQEVGIYGYDSFVNYKNETEILKDDILDLEVRDQSLAERFGAICVNAVLPYTHDGLADTEEDSVVLDLLSSPKNPCGDEPTEIRLAVNEIRTVKMSINSEHDSLDYNDRLAVIAQIEKEAQQEKSNDGILKGMLIGATTMGGLWGAISLTSELDYRKQMSEKSDRPLFARIPRRKSGIVLLLNKIFK